LGNILGDFPENSCGHSDYYVPRQGLAGAGADFREVEAGLDPEFGVRVFAELKKDNLAIFNLALRVFRITNCRMQSFQTHIAEQTFCGTY
jgi:hypothetical protein